jgi:ribosomal protein L28
MPNIQRVAIPDGNTTKRVNICTRCLRTLHKS